MSLFSLLVLLAPALVQGSCSSTSPYASLPLCKVTPYDLAWPNTTEWANLNSSVGGALIATIPPASSCYSSNPYNSDANCTYVINNWGYSAFHASLPESIDYPLWANNSCLPPDATGYNETLGCHIGGAPQYVLNVTSNDQISTALTWASERNLRVVVKGTGHDLNGRSSGAFSLSIWTHSLKSLALDSAWPIPGQNTTAEVLIAGSGSNWGECLRYTLPQGRAVVSGVDATVGLGGFIGAGGHGSLSSTFGLAADQLLQVTIVTPSGDILTANDVENTDLFWAVRGGGGGQYGIVTEYVMLTYPSPTGIVGASISVSAANLSDYSDETINATWLAFSSLMSKLPDLMDQGVTGSGTAGVEGSATRLFGLSASPPGIILSLSLWAYNTTVESFGSLMNSTQEAIIAELGSSAPLLTFEITEPAVTANYSALFESMNGSPSMAGSASLVTSRLLGRGQFDNHTMESQIGYWKRVMDSQVEGAGTYLTIGLQAGPGPRKVPAARRGALNQVWRETYMHVIATGINLDLDTKTPGQALLEGAAWAETNKEGVWREWAPETGAYMNEANPYNGEWQHDFYGTSYERLVGIKRQYDPTHMMHVLSGVDSDYWNYDLDTGKLCQTV